MPLRNRIFTIGVALVAIFALNCSHISHRANVEEGVNASLMAGPSWETYDPPNRDYYDIYDPDNDFSERGATDFQVSWGYAWKFRNTRKLMPQINFALALAGGYYFPSAGLYYQATHENSPSAAGIGLILGLDPMVYLIWGRDFAEDNNSHKKLGTDLAFAFGSGPSYMVDYRIFYRFNKINLGLYTEYRYYPKAYDNCFEDCDYTDYLKSRWSFGVILIPSPGKRNKRYEEFPY